jgi:tRNA modification GTPase
VVINKIDLVEDDFKPEIPEAWNKIPNVKISALYGNGLSTLKDLIAELAIGDHHLEVQSTIIPNLRHKIALEKSLEFAVSASEEIRKGTSFELIAIDIKETLDSLGEIIGAVAKEDVIDQIFNRFCIGK